MMSDTTKNAVEPLEEYKEGLLKSIAIAIQTTNGDDDYSVGLRNGLRVCKAYIDELEPEYEKCKPSASPNSSESPNDWIPCSIKKHPDSKIECYVTVKDYTDDYGEEYDLIVDVDTYYPEHDAWDYYCDLDIIAWMPKNEPEEPYQER